MVVVNAVMPLSDCGCSLKDQPQSNLPANHAPLRLSPLYKKIRK